MKERTPELLGLEVMLMCKGSGHRLEEITKRVYGNMYEKNMVRVFRMLEVLMEEDVVVPCFINKQLRFKLNGGLI